MSRKKQPAFRLPPEDLLTKMDNTMTNAVTVKNITFREGETLICVPLLGKSLDELQNNARALASCGADIIEWRVDHFAEVHNVAKVLQALGKFANCLPKPRCCLLFAVKRRRRNRNQ